MLNISETKRFSGFMSNRDLIGKCLGRVDWWNVTWLYDVILVTSQCLKLSHSETRTRINYPCGYFERTLSRNIILCLKSAHSAKNSGRRSVWRNLIPRWKLRIIGIVAVRRRRVGRLKLSSARANSSTGLLINQDIFMAQFVTSESVVHRPTTKLPAATLVINYSDKFLLSEHIGQTESIVGDRKVSWSCKSVPQNSPFDSMQPRANPEVE